MYFCYTSHMYRDDAADDDDGDVVGGGCYQDESAKRKNLHDTPASLIEVSPPPWKRSSRSLLGMLMADDAIQQARVGGMACRSQCS